ncbi:MAG: AhpC/TSA family protein [Prevotellaceae bacterium]|jgi:thiol-disulfide isomerase/thioredoxin|nr:AhpC/TSA family protein [Prevotellaceae bacterium]
MKILKNLSAFLIASTIIISCTERPATSYTIKGNFHGIPDGTKVELIPGATYRDEKPVAESVVTDGKFTFTGVADEPRMFNIHIAESYGFAKLIVENGKITLTGHVEKLEHEGSVIYNFNNVEVKGSKSHDLYTQKIAPSKMMDSLYRAYHDNNKEISEAISQAYITNDNVMLDSLNQTDAYKKFAADEKNFFETVEKTMKGIIMDSKDSWWGPMLMLDVMTYITEEQQIWYEEFSPEAKNSYYGKILKKELFPEGFLGKVLPTFSLVGKDNKDTTVGEINKGKKYTLVDFWASWCGPCRNEIPNLKKLYEKYSSKGFEIISISIDKKEADWEKALKEENLTWPNFLDTKGASDAFNLKSIPAMFLVDNKGIIIAEKIRGEELETKLAELFK